MKRYLAMVLVTMVATGCRVDDVMVGGNVRPDEPHSSTIDAGWPDDAPRVVSWGAAGHDASLDDVDRTARVDAALCANALPPAPVCVPGAADECNDEPGSFLKSGTCTAEGRCVCFDGLIVNPRTGRCAMRARDLGDAGDVGAALQGCLAALPCQPGSNDTCNADRSSPYRAGNCGADGLCECRNGFALNAEGRCGPSGFTYAPGPFEPDSGADSHIVPGCSMDSGSDAGPFLCESDLDCNPNAVLSANALAGRCVGGACSCKLGYVKSDRGPCVADPALVIMGYVPEAVCVDDSDCTIDPRAMSHVGTCSAGICQCALGGTKQRSGRCGPWSETFPDVVAGSWRLDRHGEQERSSWVRLEGRTGGLAHFEGRSGSLVGREPLFDCTGQGTWSVGSRPRSILLHPPAACAGKGVPETLVFGLLTPAANSWPEIVVSLESPIGITAVRELPGTCIDGIMHCLP